MSGCYLADFQVEAALSIEGERQAMSYSSIDTNLVKTNWDNIQGAGPLVNGMVTLTLDAWDDRLYQDFTISCPGQNSSKPCSAHINMHYGFNPAHVTILSWNFGKKTNYWFMAQPNGSVANAKPGPESVAGTSKKISELPGEIKTAVIALVSAVYAGAVS